MAKQQKQKTSAAGAGDVALLGSAAAGAAAALSLRACRPRSPAEMLSPGCSHTSRVKLMFSPRSRFVPCGHWCSVKRTDMAPLEHKSPWYGCAKVVPSEEKTDEYQQYLRSGWSIRRDG